MDPVHIQRDIKAPLAKVFQAWTSPELLRQWFFPGKMTCEVESDFRVGGAYRIVMRDDEGEYPHYGMYREIVEQAKIVFTWNSKNASDTLVSVQFEGDEACTRITLEHTLFTSEEQRSGHDKGWNGCFVNLAAFVAA